MDSLYQEPKFVTSGTFRNSLLSEPKFVTFGTQIRYFRNRCGKINHIYQWHIQWKSDRNYYYVVN